MSKSLLAVICIVMVIAFSVAYADLRHKWQEEKTFRILVQELSETYKEDIDYYRQLYHDCRNGEEAVSEIALPWKQP